MVLLHGTKWNNNYGEVVLTKLDEVGTGQGFTMVKQTMIMRVFVYNKLMMKAILTSREKLIKTNFIGDTLWTRNLEIVNQQEIKELGYVRQTNDNGYILTGYNDNDNTTLIKLNQDGILLEKNRGLR